MNIKTIIILFFLCATSLDNLCCVALELSSVQQEQIKGAGTDCAYFAAISAKTLHEHNRESVERLQDLLTNEVLFHTTYDPLMRQFSQTYLYADQLERVINFSPYFSGFAPFIEVVEGALFDEPFVSGPPFLTRVLIAEQFGTKYTNLKYALQSRTLPFAIVVAMNGRHWKAKLHYIVLFVREYEGRIQVLKTDSISASYHLSDLKKTIEAGLDTHMDEDIRRTLIFEIEDTNKKAKTECAYIDNASQLLEQAFASNLVSNGNFDRWSVPNSPPDGWTIGWGAVERSTEQTKIGRYSAKTTNNVIRYRLAHPEQLRGKTLTFECWVYATTNQPSVNTTIQIFDNLSETRRTISTLHSGNPRWERLKVSHKVCGTADNVEVFLYVAGNTTSYFSGATCVVE